MTKQTNNRAFAGTCSFPGCPNPAQSRNEPLCRTHVMQKRRGGSLRPLRVRQVRTDDGTTYRCAICKETLPITAFGWDVVRDQPRRQCRPCLAKYQKQWNKEHPEAIRRTVLGRKGITPEQFDQILANQGGRCAICRCEPRSYRAFAVDHDHGTNGNRGLLCQDCNMGLGQFKDDPTILEAAAAYLRSHPKNTVMSDLSGMTDEVIVELTRGHTPEVDPDEARDVGGEG